MFNQNQLLESLTHPINQSDESYSEDYYGDLDLKSIRKSELLAGLQSSEGRQANAKPLKPRPAPAEKA